MIPVRTGNVSLMGLFIESSLNGRFIANLTRNLEPGSYVWGTQTEYVTPEIVGKDYQRYITERFRLFDIRYVYTDLKLENVLDPSLANSKRYVNSYPAPKLSDPVAAASLSERYNTHENLLDFYLYPVASSGLAEALHYVPKALTSDWKVTNQKWFLGTPGVPIFTDHPAPPGVRAARPGETVEVLQSTPRMDRIVFQINSDQDIPVFVKIGYLPIWKLSVEGKSAPVYRASPNLILIFGHGRAVLQYHRPWEEYLGYLLFLAGIALLILL